MRSAMVNMIIDSKRKSIKIENIKSKKTIILDMTYSSIFLILFSSSRTAISIS